MEFQVGMRFFQVLSDLRIREIELVEIHKSEGWGDGKTRHGLHFLPASRKGAGVRGRADPDGSLDVNEENENGVLLSANVFTTVERAHRFALDRAGVAVNRARRNIAKANSEHEKAMANLYEVRKAAGVA